MLLLLNNSQGSRRSETTITGTLGNTLICFLLGVSSIILLTF